MVTEQNQRLPNFSVSVSLWLAIFYFLAKLSNSLKRLCDFREIFSTFSKSFEHSEIIHKKFPNSKILTKFWVSQKISKTAKILKIVRTAIFKKFIFFPRKFQEKFPKMSTRFYFIRFSFTILWLSVSRFSAVRFHSVDSGFLKKCVDLVMVSIGWLKFRFCSISTAESKYRKFRKVRGN